MKAELRMNGFTLHTGGILRMVTILTVLIGVYFQTKAKLEEVLRETAKIQGIQDSLHVLADENRTVLVRLVSHDNWSRGKSAQIDDRLNRLERRPRIPRPVPDLVAPTDEEEETDRVRMQRLLDRRRP